VTQTMLGFTVWFTGLPCSGKSTQAQLLAAELELRGWGVEILDADASCDAGDAANQSHRQESNDEIRRIAYVARLLNKHGAAVIVDSVSADSKVRNEVRDAAGKFAEVYVKATLVTCFQRDKKGMYRKAMAGEIRGFTGIDEPYEPPLCPELILGDSNEIGAVLGNAACRGGEDTHDDPERHEGAKGLCFHGVPYVSLQ